MKTDKCSKLEQNIHHGDTEKIFFIAVKARAESFSRN